MVSGSQMQFWICSMMVESVPSGSWRAYSATMLEAACAALVHPGGGVGVASAAAKIKVNTLSATFAVGGAVLAVPTPRRIF